jgi:hypothetical protein
MSAPNFFTSDPAQGLSDDAEAAKDWLNTAPHRLDVALMVATAAEVRRDLSADPSGACARLVDAVFALDDEFPPFRSVGSRDPLIQNLEDAASKYNLAGQACSIGLTSGVRANLDRGDALERKAEQRARALGTRI